MLPLLREDGPPRQERNFSPRRPAPQYRLMRRQEQRDRKLRAKKPANGGPSPQVSTKCRIARLGGGARSHFRTGLYRHSSLLTGKTTGNFDTLAVRIEIQRATPGQIQRVAEIFPE